MSEATGAADGQPRSAAVTAGTAAGEDLSADHPFRERRLNDADDFRPAWDVPSLNREITEPLLRQIAHLPGRATPDPGQLIPVLLSAGGYGKTHLFGRLRHALGDHVFFVFVPAVNDVRRPLEHIRWHVVEGLFDATVGRPSMIERALAESCRESFVKYLEQLPAERASRHGDLLQRVYDGSAGVLEVARAVRGWGGGLRPWLRLADSVAAATPQVPTAVMRALALGWSPAADRARRWLRGESLPEEDLAELALPREPALPIYVLQGVAAALRYQRPMVLCCDQLDSVLKDREEGPRQLAIQLMEILAEVPNQFIILSCLEDQWRLVVANKAADAFRQRVREFLLKPLKEREAVELVANRLRDWHERREKGNGEGRGEVRGEVGSAKPPAASAAVSVSPFEVESVIEYARENQPNPRALIARCADAFDRWREGGERGLIDLMQREVRRPDLLAAFIKEWAREVDEIHGNARRGLNHTQEARLFEAVEAVLEVARVGGRPMGGVHVLGLRRGAVTPGGSHSRLSLKVDLAESAEVSGGGEGEGKERTYSLIVPVTKLDNGYVFRFYYEAIEEALTGPVVGAVLIHARKQFAMGNKTKADVERDQSAGKLRLFALQEHRATFEAMECALTLLEKAASQELQVAGQTLSADQCRDLMLKANVLDGLDLFAALGKWPGAV